MNEALRIPLVDHLRGLAAISVTWFHMTNGHEGWVRQSGSMGWLGVEAFFVISGFVIPLSLANARTAYRLSSFPAFVAQRFVRLEPPYLASIAIVIILNAVAASTPLFRGPPPAFEPLQIGAHLLYLVPLTNFEWVQPVYWTLAFEFVFYLTIGVLFPFVGAASQKWRARALAAGLIALIASGAISYLLALFVMGGVVFRRLCGQDGLVWTLCLIVASVTAMAIRGSWEASLIGAFTSLAILFHRSIPTVGGKLGAVLTGLGSISYSLYLVHVPIGGKIVNLGRRLTEGDLAELALSLAGLGVSVLAAILFWRLIEAPCARTARGIRLKSNSAAALASEI